MSMQKTNAVARLFLIASIWFRLEKKEKDEKTDDDEDDEALKILEMMKMMKMRVKISSKIMIIS